jgi:hypothetical protein
MVKMNKLTIIFTFLFLALSVYGQEKYLKLENKSTPQIRTVPKNSKIEIKTDEKSKKYIKGKFEILNDSLLLVEADTILLEDIIILKARSRVTDNIGQALVIIGGVLAASGTVFLLQTLENQDSMGFVLGGLLGLYMIGGGAFSLGSGFDLQKNGRIYKRAEWDMTITSQK